ncbi:MAG: glycosyl hydrolase 115 family protein [Paraprevotella sp.]|nr:glycosyl hydrolase 115 family protein [Paraprevotella sp.]
MLNCVNVWADINVSNSATGGFPLVGTDCQATFVIDSLDAEVVSTVAGCVIADVKTITGKTLQLAHELQVGQFPIIAGTVGQSRWVDRLVAEGKVDTTGVTGRWEAYTLQLIENPSEGISQALVILGGTPRGTAYGLFEVSRRIGVSPYIWWADVQPAPQSTLYLSGDRTEVEAPSVQYRGLFINDEDWAMLPWAKNTIDQAVKNIGPNTYAQLMELLLRLRANCLWPAKHAQSQAFWSLEANKRLAKKWAIVMSSGDSMLRDNLWEWRRFSGTGSEGFSFAYNSAQITDYWAKRAGEARDYEAIYDIGMRGLQDVALLGYEGQEAQLAGLTDIIAAQRKIITDSLGGDPTRVPQIYIPYKEALTLYNAGLQIPDDVTLCWVDDNYAYIRQLPTAAEQLRSGGNGIYYHLSYLGNPCSYIWLSTISPSLISYELSKAYENGMKRFWMVNVGDLKPAEVEFEFCMELAWNVNAWTPEKAWTFSRWWAAKTFGEDYADELAEIRLEHYRLAAQSKPETVREVTFSIGEMEQRIQDYQNLEARVNAMESQIPARLRDAYFQLFTYPIVATAHQNYKLLGANLSFWYAAMGNRTKALSYASQARVSYQRITSLTSKYNTGIQGGKWNGMMNMSPNAGSTSQFGMPQVASSSDVNTVQGPLPEYSMQTVDAASYTDSRGAWTTIKNLGVGGQSVTVWPIDYNTYTTTTARTRAPYVEYTLPLKKGNY